MMMIKWGMMGIFMLLVFMPDLIEIASRSSKGSERDD